MILFVSDSQFCQWGNFLNLTKQGVQIWKDVHVNAVLVHYWSHGDWLNDSHIVHDMHFLSSRSGSSSLWWTSSSKEGSKTTRLWQDHEDQ
jgi:hypothetical protein